MRVIHLITNLSSHGAQMMLYKFLTHMDQRRFDSVVISLRDRGSMAEKIEALGVPVYDVGINEALPSPASIWRLIRLVRYLRPDVIQGWMYHANLAAQVAAFFARKKVTIFWSIHQSLYSFHYEKPITAVVIKLCARLSSLAEKIIYVSNTSVIQHEAIGYHREKRLVIPIGFDTDTFIPSPEARAGVRSELGLAEDALLIGLIARYHPMKDHGNFLRAASLLLKSHPQVHFVLAGESVDPHNQDLLAMTEDLHIASRVHLLGERTDMPRITAALDIASSSAFAEAFPTVVGEAMACGVPCVVTNVGDSGWIVGEIGRIVPPRDALALAKAWEELIEMSDEQRQVLGKEARGRVLENFSLDASVRQYEALYETAGFSPGVAVSCRGEVTI